MSLVREKYLSVGWGGSALRGYLLLSASLRQRQGRTRLPPVVAPAVGATTA
jgi:hypothetical protein